VVTWYNAAVSANPDPNGNSENAPDLEQAILGTGLFTGPMGFAPLGTFEGQLEAMLRELADPSDVSVQLEQLERALAEEQFAEAEELLPDAESLLGDESLSILNEILGFDLIPETDLNR
jgi:hypothetical protein